MRDSGMRQREIWIEFDGLLKHLQCVVDVLPPRVRPAPQEEIIGLEIFGRLLADGLVFLWRQGDAEGLRDAAPSCCATCGAVTGLSRKASISERGKITSWLILESSVMMSSVIPSRKYSSSL